jgi:methyl-accepting chemotaxis protein
MQSLNLAIAAGILSICILVSQVLSSGKNQLISMWLSTFTLLVTSLFIFALSGGNQIYLIYHMILPAALIVYFRNDLIIFFGAVSGLFFVLGFFMNEQLVIYKEEITLQQIYLSALITLISSVIISMIMSSIRNHVEFQKEQVVAVGKKSEYLKESEVSYIYYLKAISDNITGTADEIRQIAAKNIDIIKREKVRLENTLETARVMQKTFLETKGAIFETREIVEKTLQAAIKGDNDISDIMQLVNKMVKFVDITKKSIYDLSAATKKVEGVISVIDKIANHTRLLSLNASIEGARFESRQAGFVMVSKEVKELSALTHLSVQEVTNTMRDIHTKTRMVQEVVVKEGQEAMEGLDVAKLGEQSVRYVVRMMQSIESEVAEIISDLEKNESLAGQISEHLAIIESFIIENLERMEYLEATSMDMKIQGENLDKIIHANRVIEEYSRVNDKIYALLARFGMEFEKIIEHEIRRGTIDEVKLFDRNFNFIEKNENDEKGRYTSNYDEFFRSVVQEVIDKYLAMQPELRYFILMDNEGYVPLINEKYPVSIESENHGKYNIASQPGVIMADYASKYAVKSDNLYTLQCVQSQEEQVMDMAVHLHFKGKIWGVSRAGFRYS